MIDSDFCIMKKVESWHGWKYILCYGFIIISTMDKSNKFHTKKQQKLKKQQRKKTLPTKIDRLPPPP